MQPDEEDLLCERTYVVRGQGSILLLDLQPVERALCMKLQIKSLKEGVAGRLNLRPLRRSLNRRDAEVISRRDHSRGKERSSVELCNTYQKKSVL